MKIKEIIKLLKDNNLYKEDNIKDDIEISYLSYSSLDIKKDTLFICKGKLFKEEYLKMAQEKGSVCYVSEIKYQEETPYILVNNITLAMALISKYFYNYDKDITLIGVTGTKGKTTTISFLRDIINNYTKTLTPYSTTIDYYTGKNSGISHNTTPESMDVYKYINEAKTSFKDYFLMEVSSQAYKMNRIYGLCYDYGIFLNIAPDHISEDEHKDFNEYREAKLGFLKKCKNVILYKDILTYDYIYNTLIDSGVKVYTIGYSDSDFLIKDVKKVQNYTYFTLSYLGKDYNFKLSIEGSFNVINAGCAVGISLLLNIPYNFINEAIFKTEVKGRMNVFKDYHCPIIVDYAHNELSVSSLFKSLKQDYPNRNLKVVFGCPGDKAVNRRKELAMLSKDYAQKVYVTMEDPGSKSFYDISDEIISYLKPYNIAYEVIIDREEAIIKAINEANEDDLIAIIGKGDENYQLINGKYVPYKSDIKVVEECINKIKSEVIK